MKITARKSLIRNSIAASLALGAIGTVIGMGSSRVPSMPEAHAGSGKCTNASLSDPYAFIGSGTTSGMPLSSVGRYIFDGNGGFTGYAFTTVSGYTARYPQSGTYTVAPDCSATMDVTIHSPDGSNSSTVLLRLELLDKGDSFVLSADDPNQMLTAWGEGKRM